MAGAYYVDLNLITLGQFQQRLETQEILPGRKILGEEHYNCVADIEAFERQAPLATVLFRGAMPLKKYTRFMLIGYR